MAIKNQEEDLKFISMNEMVFGMLSENIEEEELSEEMIEEILREDCMMYVLTNKRNQFGASMILNKNIMQTISEKISGNFFLLPSSIHEWILVLADIKMTPEELSGMVQEINDTQIEIEERLSDNVYVYTEDFGIKVAS